MYIKQIPFKRTDESEPKEFKVVIIKIDEGETTIDYGSVLRLENKIPDFKIMDGKVIYYIRVFETVESALDWCNEIKQNLKEIDRWKIL